MRDSFVIAWLGGHGLNRGRVLLITSDRELTLSLERALNQAGFGVEIATTAQEGYRRAVESQPHCIICDIYLDDIEGTWVVAKLRTERSEVAISPILLLGDAFDLDTALQGLKAGADCYLLKPLTERAVVRQTEALIHLVSRIKERKDSFIPPSSAGPLALRGDLEQLSLTTILMVIEMERRSGLLSLTTGGEPEQRAVFTLAEGTFVSSTWGERPLEFRETLRRVVHWNRGRFWFIPVDESLKPNPNGTIGGLLLNVMREMDEENR